MIERYSLPEASRIWLDATRYAYWLEVELALCQALVKHRIMPKKDYDYLKKKLSVHPKSIAALEEEVKHDILAFTQSMEEQGGKQAQFFHYGLTSSDVLDTAFALQLREASILIVTELKKLLLSLEKLAKKTKAIPAIGRSHGMHGEPLSFGLRFASMYGELKRSLARIEEAKEVISYGQFSGAVGAYGELSPAIEKDACGYLDLKVEPISTQVIPRDRHAQFFSSLAILGASIERLAVEFRHLQRTEVGELEEGFSKKQKGSSAMPHKKNPISGENLTGCARLLRAWADASMENVALWHERDISHSSVERVIAPDACILAHYMCVRARKLVDGVVIHPDRIRKNLHATKDSALSGALLLLFVKAGLERHKAYRLLQKHTLPKKGSLSLEDSLCKDPLALQYVTKKEIRAVLSQKRGLRYVDHIYQRVFLKKTQKKSKPKPRSKR